MTNEPAMEERVTFDHLPKILSTLQKDVNELKNFIVHNQVPDEPNEWMDVKGLAAYHPDHPSVRTVYDWIHYKRVRFKRTEIDKWLLGGYHRIDNELLEDAVDILNAKRCGQV